MTGEATQAAEDLPSASKVAGRRGNAIGIQLQRYPQERSILPVLNEEHRLMIVREGCEAEQWDVNRAAERLGMSRSYLYTFIQRNPGLKADYERARKQPA